MKAKDVAIAAGVGMAAGAAVSMMTGKKKSKMKKTADKAIKTAGQIVEGISQSMDSVM